MIGKKEKGKPFSCPYCDEEIRAAELPWCVTCGENHIICSSCQKPLYPDSKICKYCGADQSAGAAESKVD